MMTPLTSHRGPRERINAKNKINRNNAKFSMNKNFSNKGNPQNSFASQEIAKIAAHKEDIKPSSNLPQSIVLGSNEWQQTEESRSVLL